MCDNLLDELHIHYKLRDILFFLFDLLLIELLYQGHDVMVGFR